MLALVALGVLGRADLASLGVGACAALSCLVSCALDYFAGGFWWHVYIYLRVIRLHPVHTQVRVHSRGIALSP